MNQSLRFETPSEYDVLKKHCTGYIGGFLLSVYAMRGDLTSYPVDIHTNQHFFNKIGEGCQETLRDFEYKTEMDPSELRALQIFYQRNFIE
jgi:hypothetical protein